MRTSSSEPAEPVLGPTEPVVGPAAWRLLPLMLCAFGLRDSVEPLAVSAVGIRLRDSVEPLAVSAVGFGDCIGFGDWTEALEASADVEATRCIDDNMLFPSP